jgi:hypothetical protein
LRDEHGYIQTYTGRKFWPLEPEASELDIMDIAHGLAHNCRWTGHCSKFYSVAQHSILASHLVPEGMELTALLHDASEAYLSDLSRPVKHSPEMKPYRDAEARLEKVIAEKYGTTFPMPKEVKLVDNKLLYTERRDLFKQRVEWTTDKQDVLGVEGDDERTPYPQFHIVPWQPEKAEIEFLLRFTELTTENNN